MQLGSGIAVAMAWADSSDLTPSLGTSTCLGCGPKKMKEREEWREDEGRKKITPVLPGREEAKLSHAWSQQRNLHHRILEWDFLCPRLRHKEKSQETRWPR